MSAQKRKKKQSGKAGRSPMNTDRRIVLIDDAPLRKRAAAAFDRTMKDLETARAEWHRFETEDRPAYAQWLAATFGALMTEIRENTRKIAEQDDLISDVEMEVMWGSAESPREAYATTIKRREKAESGEDPFDSDDDPDSESSGEGDDEDDFDPFGNPEAMPSEDEFRTVFEAFIRDAFFLDPKDLSKKEYDEMFAKFQADLTGNTAQGTAPGPSGARPHPAAPGGARIKEIYRILVRRLHPDLRADSDAQVSALWHEVQEAYETSNLERLETLLALTEMRTGASGGNVMLSQMRAATEELRRALGAIRRSIQDVKRDHCWNFSRTQDRKHIEKRIRHEMQTHLGEQRRILSAQRQTLDDWSRPFTPRKKKKKNPKKKKEADTHPDSIFSYFRDEEFPF